MMYYYGINKNSHWLSPEHVGSVNMCTATVKMVEMITLQCLKDMQTHRRRNHSSAQTVLLNSLPISLFVEV